MLMASSKLSRLAIAQLSRRTCLHFKHSFQPSIALRYAAAVHARAAAVAPGQSDGADPADSLASNSPNGARSASGNLA